MEVASTVRELPPVTLTAIPALPEAAMYVISVTSKADAKVQDVARALGTDQSIALRFLSIANSPYFSPKQRITTLSRCVTWLGLEFVRSTLVTMGVDRIASKAGTMFLDRTAFWRHNMGTGACCEMIARRLAKDWEEEAYVAGLTHDIGKQVLCLAHGNEYDRCLEEAAARCRPLFEVEEALLGMDHAMAGALALREWRFNPELVHVVLNHHEPAYQGPQEGLMAVLDVAHAICTTIGYGRSGDVIIRNPDPASSHKLGIDQSFIHNITNDLERSLEDLDAVVLAVNS